MFVIEPSEVSNISNKYKGIDVRTMQHYWFMFFHRSLKQSDGDRYSQNHPQMVQIYENILVQMWTYFRKASPYKEYRVNIKCVFGLITKNQRATLTNGMFVIAFIILNLKLINHTAMRPSTLNLQYQQNHDVSKGILRDAYRAWNKRSDNCIVPEPNIQPLFRDFKLFPTTEQAIHHSLSYRLCHPREFLSPAVGFCMNTVSMISTAVRFTADSNRQRMLLNDANLAVMRCKRRCEENMYRHAAWSYYYK